MSSYQSKRARDADDLEDLSSLAGGAGGDALSVLLDGGLVRSSCCFRARGEVWPGCVVVYKLNVPCNPDAKDASQTGDEMAGSSGPASGMTGLLLEGFPVLSGAARKFVRSHPREARAVVAAALEAVAVQRGVEDITDVPERLRPFVVRQRADDGILGVSEAANRLAVSRTTVYEWARTTRLIAWRATKRGLRIPAAQILGAGRVVPALKDVVDVIGDPELAWAFLTQEWAFENMVALPLDLLEDGRVDEVLDAAPGFGATFT